MSTDFDLKMKALAALNERVQGFLNDGYHVIIDYNDDTLRFVKLRHHNGNRIVVKLDITNGILSQYTNHIRNYEEKVC